MYLFCRALAVNHTTPASKGCHLMYPAFRLRERRAALPLVRR